jgi:hypothetical protein
MRPTSPRRASCSENLPERNRRRISGVAPRWIAHQKTVSPEASFKAGQIVYTPLLAPTRLQRSCEASGELYRIVRPIKHLDEDRNGYDLTRAFIEEALFFPFAPHDDLIDACARIYDMSPVPAQRWERGAFEAPVHPDA